MFASTVTTKPMTNLSRNAARVAFAASAVFVILLAALHVIRPDLDPSWRFISEYELGDNGWMMRLAFFSLALSCISLGLAIRLQIRTIPGYLGLIQLALGAMGMIMGGLFLPDRVSATGKLHDLGAMLDGVPIAAVLINWSLARNQAWSWARRILCWTAWLPLLGTVLFAASMAILLSLHGGFGPDVLVGWPNRIMILSHCAWLTPVAWCTLKTPVE
jgi:hypothetical protein